MRMIFITFSHSFSIKILNFLNTSRTSLLNLMAYSHNIMVCSTTNVMKYFLPPNVETSNGSHMVQQVDQINYHHKLSFYSLQQLILRSNHWSSCLPPLTLVHTFLLVIEPSLASPFLFHHGTYLIYPRFPLIGLPLKFSQSDVSLHFAEFRTKPYNLSSFNLWTLLFEQLWNLPAILHIHSEQHQELLELQTLTIYRSIDIDFDMLIHISLTWSNVAKVLFWNPFWWGCMQGQI